MKRGIIRIISGIVLLILQVLSIVGSAGANASGNLGYYIGFYSPAIIGIALLVFGFRAYRNEIYSALVLHSKSKKIHTVVKWVGFTVSTLLFIYYLLYFITNLSDFDIFSLFNLFGTVAFSVYALFYMYKKPSCLFSATLVFVGVAYIYGIISNLSYYILYLPDADFFIPYVFTGILPRLFAGILYIVVATIVFKEIFSTNTVKVLGWIIFALEFLNRVVSSIVVMQSLYLGDLVSLVYLLFVVILMLYTSVLKMNTMRAGSTPDVENKYYSKQKTEHSFESIPVPDAGWRCSCGRPHPRYETSCICGKSKFESITCPQPEAASTETTDQILFCRKCGAKLLTDSQFCSKCGTEIIEI